MPHTYAYPRPALTADIVIFGYDGERLQVLLIQRDAEPFAGAWALPGGFVHENESLDEAAHRELVEETGVSEVYLEQLYTYGDAGRDPRGHVVTVAYFALIDRSRHQLHAATDARDARWFPIDACPTLAFDHKRICQDAVSRLQAKIRYQPLGFELLPQSFLMADFQRLYEAILAKPLDKRNFAKRMKATGLLEETGESVPSARGPAAKLLRYKQDAYQAMIDNGDEFLLLV